MAFGKKKSVPPAKSESETPKVRRVQSVDEAEHITNPTEQLAAEPAAQSEAQKFVADAAHTANEAVTNKVETLKSNWFGLKPGFMSISKKVSSAASYLHISSKAMGAILAAVTLVVGGGGLFTYHYAAQHELFLRTEDYIDPCPQMIEEAQEKTLDMTDSGDPDAMRLENARKLWAVLRSYKSPNGNEITPEMAAGALGNMTVESNLDPTSVEAIFDEPFQIGPRKSVLFPIPSGTHNSYFQSMHAMYNRQGLSINASAYLFDGRNYCVGIGLIGWTGPTGKGLIDFAEANDKNWYDLDVQAACLLGQDKVRLEHFTDRCSPNNNVDNATAYWLGIMERGLSGPNTSEVVLYSRRAAAAQDWYDRLHDDDEAIQREYKDFAEEVWKMAGTQAGKATNDHAQDVIDYCAEDEEEEPNDNGTLAEAEVAFAWPSMGDSYNNGTALYRAVYDAVNGTEGGKIYKSCDRGVCTAVRWSGADDNFPTGACPNQMAYMEAHPDIWKPMGAINTLQISDLQPGDICVNPGHIWMFVGNEIIQEKYPGNAAVMVEASYGTRSPGCCPIWGNYYPGPDGHGYGQYYVFRYQGDYSGSKKTAYTGNASGTSA